MPQRVLVPPRQALPLTLPMCFAARPAPPAQVRCPVGYCPLCQVRGRVLQAVPGVQAEARDPPPLQHLGVVRRPQRVLLVRAPLARGSALLSVPVCGPLARGSALLCALVRAPLGRGSALLSVLVRGPLARGSASLSVLVCAPLARGSALLPSLPRMAAQPLFLAPTVSCPARTPGAISVFPSDAHMAWPSRRLETKQPRLAAGARAPKLCAQHPAQHKAARGGMGSKFDTTECNLLARVPSLTHTECNLLAWAPSLTH